MKSLNKTLLIPFIWLLVSCSNLTEPPAVEEQKESTESTEYADPNKSLSDYSFDLEKHKKQFKLSSLTKFSIDTSAGEFQQVDRISFYEIFQDTTEQKYYDPVQLKELGEEAGHYYYSTQPRNSPFTEITIMAEESYWGGTSIWYLIYDKNGKFIDKFRVASEGADGGEYWKEWGEFIDHDNYLLTSVECVMGAADNTIDCDSIITQYTISQDGKVESNETFFKSYTQNVK